MEDVLEVYQRPYDERRPMIAMDEVPKQLVAELRLPIAARPGQPRRVDYEYRRNGTANIFMLFEPLAARRRVKVTERRTKVDWAYLIRDLVDVHYPEAEIVVLVMDNLNTHAKASLYEAFEPKEAKRIADKLEIHYTPKHGSSCFVAKLLRRVALAQCCRKRTECHGPAVSGQANPRHPAPHTRSCGMAAKTRRRSQAARLAVHCRRCTHQIEKPLPITTMLTEH